jgi:hypothetical protein
MFPFPNIVFKHPVAITYNLFHIYFHLKFNLSYSDPSSTLHSSVVYDHHQVGVLHLPKIFALLRQNFVSHVNAVFLD